jgi:hypothetical protein
MSIERRIFVVGCARAGTTILQALIAAHPAVHTFPESRLMRSISPAGRLAAKLGLATRHARDRMAAIYPELGFDAAACARRLRVSAYIRDFVRQADAKALDLGKTAWLEKTPDHVQYLETLGCMIPDAFFVHILRNGYDNVCSLLDITRKHRSWGPRPLTLEECANRWRNDALISLRQVGSPRHLVLRHADLVREPGAVMERVMAFLDMDFQASQLAGSHSSRVASPNEPWKDTVRGGVHASAPDQYLSFLEPAQSAWLQKELAPVQERIDAMPFPAPPPTTTAKPA